MAVAHYENFPVASWLTPAHLRPTVVALYWFARTADDLADEGDHSVEQRLAQLSQYGKALAAVHAQASESASTGKTAMPALPPDAVPWPREFGALRQAIARHQLPLALLDALLQAFVQDVRYTAKGHWYVDEDELLDYASRSANPIGRLLLHLYGVQEADALAESDAICSALQLINFWQDVSVDLPRKRYYLPLKHLQNQGLKPDMVSLQQDPAATARVVQACCAHAHSLMLQGTALPERVRQQVGGLAGWQLALELKLVMHGGLHILEKLAQQEYQSLTLRPKLGKSDAPRLLLRALKGVPKR